MDAPQTPLESPTQSQSGVAVPVDQKLLAFNPEPKKKRLRGRPWGPGVSGNLNGRPRNIAPRMTSKEIRNLILRKGAPVLNAVVKMAKGGDMVAARAIFDLTLPRGRVLNVSLPKVRDSASAAEMLTVLLEHVSEGAVTPAEANSLSAVVQRYANIAAMAQIEKRVASVETKLAQGPR